MNARKHLLAVLALGASGFAFAQSTAPTVSPPATTQQSQAGTPMNSSTVAQASPSQSTSPGTTTPSQAPAAMPSTTPDTSSTPAAQPQTTEPMRPARADRN
ncbi:proteophosphoglycan ppg4 [Variovorax guangxiensis]|uniref:proteophosphoglycan ppg4 n=1 Tax=Variovorax guangxiensis TaxID=1775474 RepID=UPI002858585A|nr:proteophosphoglycan ppg4 [Variovorax guangxiensis]MDR6853912.1 cytoskeletal protein RodZ [Variovorax guangxiensis]